MFCQSQDLSETGYFKDCQDQATEIVWCPTWIYNNGPLHLCERHSRNFKPEFNEYATDGEFYWGDEAIKQYKLWKEKQILSNKI